MREHVATVEEILGPVLGPRVTAILAKNPPPIGEDVEIKYDNSAVRWVDEQGQTRQIDLTSRGVWFGELEEDEDEDDDLDDEGEQGRVA